MSARDDYPVLEGPTARSAQRHEMCDEIDRLREWKAEAILVIGKWELCFDVLVEQGHAARLGEFKSTHVRRWIEQNLIIDNEER
jgi:hypothetical protein